MKTCSSIQRHLDAYALGALTMEAETRVAAHLEQCASCRAAAQGRQALLRQLADEARRHADELNLALPHIRDRADRPEATTPFRARPAADRYWNRSRLALAATALALLGGAVALPYWRPAVAPQAAMQVAWTRPGIVGRPGDTAAHPIVVGNRVATAFLDRQGPRVAVFDRETGLPQWQTPVPGMGALAADARRIYLRESGSGRVLALDAANGDELWRSRNDAPQTASHYSSSARPPLLLDKTLCWTAGPHIVCARKDNGKLLWSQAADGRRVRGMTCGADRLYAFSDHSYWALDAASGAVLWQRPHEQSLSAFGSSAFIACDDEHLYLARATAPDRGSVAAFDLRSGTPRWQRQTRAPLNLQAMHGRVYVKSHKLEALAADSGRTLWSAHVEGCSPVAEANGLLFFVGGIRKQEVFALDHGNGTPVWSLKLAGSCGGLAVQNGWGYFNGHNGTLYALLLQQPG